MVNRGILVDTSVIIDFLRQKDKNKTFFINLQKSNLVLFVSVITHTECFSGKSVWERKEAQQALEEVLSNTKVLPIDENLSKNAGKIKAYEGTNLGDALIAATAISHKLILATLNTKRFEKIKGMRLFK